VAVGRERRVKSSHLELTLEATALRAVFSETGSREDAKTRRKTAKVMEDNAMFLSSRPSSRLRVFA
jgi:hypothetical protein